MTTRHGGEPLEAGVVDDLLTFEQAAVSVVGVFAQADVGHDHEVKRSLPQRSDRLLDDPVRGVCAVSLRVL